MPLVSMKEMLAKARDGKYAVGHFNLNNLEFTQAILLAAQEEEAPVVCAVSPGYLPHLGGFAVISAMVRALIEEYAIKVPVALHLDHGASFEQCMQAMRAGFTSVMIDASHHPLQENIRITKQTAEAARALGVSVEAEIGRIAGSEDEMTVDEREALLADPEECAKLVEATGIDCLAPALGSVHGPYKGKPDLDYGRMARIRDLTGVPLVLHGGTGIPAEDLRRAISHGIAKININADNQLACTAAVRKALQQDAEMYDPRKYLGAAREAVKAKVKEKMRQFGCSGMA